MVTIYLFLIVLYPGLMFLLLRLWVKSKPITPNCNTVKLEEKVSLLLPLRDELLNIEFLFLSVSQLSYRPLELLVIDDHSSDGGIALLESLIAAHPKEGLEWKVIKNPGQGKKAALTAGIGIALGEYIFTTDADCTFPEHWIENMLKPFSDFRVQMVAGPVLSNKGLTFFESFQQIEWASILAVTQAGFALGRPLMCSAANMAYRKSAFLAVNGYAGNDRQLSGDDEFLLKKLVKAYGPLSVAYVKSPQALVLTKPHSGGKDFWMQRVRWSSKWKAHKDFVHVVSSVLPVLLQSLFIISPLIIFDGLYGFFAVSLLWLSKITAEKVLLGRVLASFSMHHPLKKHVLTSLVHPFYVLVVAFGAIFGKFVWKGRSSEDIR